MLAGAPATASNGMENPHPERERGRSRRRSQSFRKPFQAFKTILARKMRLDRSDSRDRSPPPSFTHGTIEHAHSVPVAPTDIPLYLPIHIDLSGAIITPEESVKIGTVVCNCDSPSVPNTPKQILFTAKQTPQLRENDHYVASPFVIPEVSDTYRRTHESFPLFFRMDTSSFPVLFGRPLGNEISFVDLKNAIHVCLMDMQTQFSDDDVDHVYEILFSVVSQADPPLPDRSADPHLISLDPSAPPYVGGTDGVDQVEEVAQLLFDRSSPPHPVPVGRSAANRPILPPNPSPPTQPAFIESGPVMDFVGILFVFCQAASLLDIPRVDSIKDLVTCLKSWSQAGCKAIFISRNLVTDQIDLFPFTRAPRINPFCPLVISPQKMCAAILTSSEAGARGAPQRSLPLTSRLAKWYARLHQGVVDQDLFSKPPSSPSKASSSPQDSEDEGPFGRRSRRSSRPLSLERDPPPTQYASAVPVPPVLSSLAVDVFTPPILNRPDCPAHYRTFWNLKALPRPSTTEGSRGKPVMESSKFVAPRYPVKMKEVAAHVNLPNLLSDEFEAYAKVYQAIVVEKQYSSVDTARSYVALSIQNDADVLAVLGKDKILDTIKKNAPVLREQKLDKLTEAELQSFFFQARTYLLNSQAPYWSFPEYFLNARVFGHDIFNKITELLFGFPSYKSTLRTFSSFIESSIRQILPIQESYADSEERIITNHKSLLLGPVPSVEHTKISLQADAQELVIKSPFYKQNKTMTEEMKRHLIDMFKSNLIIKIISNTHFETELIQLLIANDKYHSLDVVPFPELISNLENLILVAQKTETIEVNAARNGNGRPSRTASRAGTSSKARPTRRTPTPKSVSPRAPRPRSRNPSGSQEACDICLLYEFDFRWCRQQDHCRVSGHQPTSKKSETRENQIRSGDLSHFIIQRDCNKCNPRVMNVAAPHLMWPAPPYSQILPRPRPPSPKRPSEPNPNVRPPWSFPPPHLANQRRSSTSPSRFSTNRR